MLSLIINKHHHKELLRFEPVHSRHTVFLKCWDTTHFNTKKYLPAVPSTAKARSRHGVPMSNSVHVQQGKQSVGFVDKAWFGQGAGYAICAWPLFNGPKFWTPACQSGTLSTHGQLGWGCVPRRATLSFPGSKAGSQIKMVLWLSATRTGFNTGGGRSWPFGKFQAHYNVFFGE